jgi:hypothetical protein
MAAALAVVPTNPAGSEKEKVDATLNQYWLKVFTASASIALKFKPLKATLWDLEGNICAGKVP